MTSSQASRIRMGRAKRWGIVVSAVAVAGLIVVPAAAASASTAAAVDPAALPTAGLNYVALGDSYSSGLGVDPQTDQPAAGCGQSSNNYPHQLAAALDLNLTDVTCAGATANNITTQNQTVTDGTRTTSVPPQITALSASTDIVTLTVGGNNLKFTQVAGACAAATAAGPLLLEPAQNNCKSFLGPQITASFADIQTALAQTYEAVKASAPNAKIFVLGYPTIAPAFGASNCFSPITQLNSFPFTDADVVGDDTTPPTPFLHTIETNLAALVKSLSTASGFTYVPTFEDSTGHSACDSTPYVNGVDVSFATGSPVIDEKSLHPNAAGVDFMAATTEPIIAAAFPATVTPPTPTLTPTPTPTVTDPAIVVPVTTPTTTALAASTSLAATGLSEPFLAGTGVLALLFLGAGLSVLVVQRKQRAQRR
ncbi:SGNH/GDSL hydrolase family protein [Subtercola endophyticus]|uniref:SGNH/GDSL hydrolase family protein n=1 Tax=Subtercola endophyticus TaxID=2895559 RepID=UPI001E5FDCDA|nr:SGNH/GDSL hydrolase family protein [Subtercola endophyticus]UFS60796.1 SGNH/GDSL hydrolase family protein [Subtercola endophyticus]